MVEKVCESSRLHGTAILLGRTGLVIRGESGSGKTTLAHTLIEWSRANGQFARFVSDDQLDMEHKGGAVIAHAPGTICGKAEVHFLGIIDIPFLPSARLDLVIRLTNAEDVARMAEEAAIDPDTGLPLLHAPAKQTPIAASVVIAHLMQSDLI